MNDNGSTISYEQAYAMLPWYIIEALRHGECTDEVVEAIRTAYARGYQRGHEKIEISLIEG